MVIFLINKYTLENFKIGIKAKLLLIIISLKKSYSLNQLSDDLFGLSNIPESGFTHLGIPVNQHGQSFPAVTIMTKVHKSATALKNLHLSIQGYKLLAHCYLFSLFTYTAYILEPPANFYKVFLKAIKSLIWANRPKVSHKRMIQSTSNYGIGLKDPKTLMSALHSSFMLRLLSENTPVSAAITEHYNSIKANHKATPNNYKFSKTHQWLKLFFTAFPKPKNTTGLYLHKSGKKESYVFHSTPLRRCHIFPVKVQDISNYSNIKPPKGTKIPLPYLKSKGILTMTNNLLQLRSKYYTPQPTLKEIYLELLNSQIPAPNLTIATINKLNTHQLSTSVFHKLWHQKLRPYSKQFCYLYLLNSLPIYHGTPCIACNEPLSQNHIFNSCSFFANLTSQSTSQLTTWIIHMSSVWLTFTKLSHSQSFHLTSAQELFKTILQSELTRQGKLSHNTINNL